MATRTSSQSGNASSSSTWGGATLVNGDIAIVATGHTVTFDASYTLGSKASGIGDALTVQATNAVTFGNVLVNSGVNLTLQGFDITTNRALKVNQYGMFNPSSGSTVTVDLATDWGSILKVDGNLTANGVTFTIPSTNITWSNSATLTLVNRSSAYHDKTNNILSFKLGTSSVTDPGPISNSAGTGLGSFGDTSIGFSSGGFDSNGGTTHVEKSSYAGLTTAGDFYVDYGKGIVWYKGTIAVVSATITYKYGTWPSWGLVAEANTTGSAVLMDNCTVNYAGSIGAATQGEHVGGGVMLDDKYAPSLDATRAARVATTTFNYCNRPLQVYNTNVTGSNSGNRLVFNGNTFNNCRYSEISNFGNGLINTGYTSYVSVTNSVFNSYSPIFVTLGRGLQNSTLLSGSTGSCIIWKLLPSSAVNSTFESNILTGLVAIDFLGNVDPVAITVPGDAANGPNIYQDNNIGWATRVARLDSYMTVRRNAFYKAYHHGMIFASRWGYIPNVTVENNIIYDSLDASNLGGGWTSGYNQKQWIDNAIVQHNTFDTGTRTISFNDLENSISLVTRTSILDNILSNSLEGIYRPASDSLNFTSLALSKNDYNDDYNNTTPTNIKQATFMRSGSEYNTGTRNVAGVYLFNPSYTLPDATSRSLVLTAAGTAGTNKSLTLAWGSGTGVDFVAFQGTATSATNTEWPTLTDTGKSFTTSGSGLKGYQVIIVSGTGSGQYAMIVDNTATQLTLVPNTTTNVFATGLDATSVYLVIKPDQRLFDSGAVQSIYAGVHSPTLALTSQTDSGITIDTHSLAVNPNYVSSSTGDYRPTNTTIANASSDGIYIGALPVLAESFQSDTFENDAFQITSSGSTYNVSITTTLTTGISESVFIGSFPSLTVAVAAAVSTSAFLNGIGNVTLPVNTGHTLLSQLSAIASNAYSVTLGVNDAVTKAAQGAVTLPVTMSTSESTTLSAVASMTASITADLQASLGGIVSAAMSLSVSVGLVLSAQLIANGLITAAISSGYALSSTLSSTSQALIGTSLSINSSATGIFDTATSIATHPTIQSIGNATLNSLLQAGISVGVASAVAKQLSEAISVGVVLGVAETGTVFAFEEGTLSATSAEVTKTLVAAAVTVVEKLVASSTTNSF